MKAVTDDELAHALAIALRASAKMRRNDDARARELEQNLITLARNQLR